MIVANFKTYEMEDDATKDLSEFALANAIYAVLVEGHAAEINSRSATRHLMRQDADTDDPLLFETGETPWTMLPRWVIFRPLLLATLLIDCFPPL